MIGVLKEEIKKQTNKLGTKMIKLFQKNIKTIGERIYYTASRLRLRLTLQELKTGGGR